MSNYVRVPVADWENICNSVRGKTGGEELLKSGELAEAITGIQTSGEKILYMDAALLDAGGAYPADADDYTTAVIPAEATFVSLEAFDNLPNLDTVIINGDPEFEVFSETISKTTYYYSALTLSDANIRKVYKGGADNLSVDVTKYMYSLNEVVIEGPASIPTYAFYGCKALRKADLRSASLISIGSYAFYECNSLREIIIAGVSNSDGGARINSYAFGYCNKLKSICIPNGVIAVESNAFYYCSSLKTVVLPETLKTIATNAFYYCTSLENLTIPASVTSIGTYAFYRCSSLKEIKIPSSVSSLGNYSFGYCTSLEKITIPASVTSISTSCFSGCPSTMVIRGYAGSYAETFATENGYTFEVIDEVLYMDASVLAAGGAYVADADDYTTAVIPADATYVSLDVLDNLPNVTKVEINGDCAFETYQIYDSISKTNINATFFSEEGCKVKNLDIRGRSAIEQGFAYGSANLTALSIDGCGSIGRLAFYQCSNLETLEFNNFTGTMIGGYAFAETGLKAVVIPDSVVEVEMSAFSWCSNLETITIPQNCLVSPYGWNGCPETMVVRGYAGSSAENMANEYGFTFEVIE